jgi:hypothetical protein
MIPVSRDVQSHYQRCYSAIREQFPADTEYARLHSDLAASLYATYLETRAELTHARRQIEKDPDPKSYKHKEIRALRRQMLVAMKAYANCLTKLTFDIRTEKPVPPQSGTALATMANGSGLSGPDTKKEKKKP